MFLERMASLSRDRVRRCESVLPAERLEESCGRLPAPPSLRAALNAGRGGESGIIAEIKRRSPSRGDINEGLELASILSAYERGGALAVSVLTEPCHFGGSLEDLREAATLTRLPLLRKDFIVHPYQLLEARAAGASAVLLVTALLEEEALVALMKRARELHLECLVEVHDERELARALRADAELVGINNRDLRTLRVDLETTLRLAPLVPAGVTLVAESGYARREDIARAQEAGVDAFLVGEALCGSDDPERELMRLRGVADALH